VSRVGSSLGAIAYAFGAPVLGLYCNVIYLVGAAWAPLGLLAVDSLVRLKQHRAVLELATVLALQVLPVVELSRMSVRTAGAGQHDIYPFSVEPYRAVEGIWPGCFGSHRHPQRDWRPLLPPAHPIKPWVPSLYLGGLTLVLALGAAGIRGGPPWRAWLTVIALVSFLGAVGEFASPVWWARAAPALRAALGGHDPAIDHPANRSDGGVADGDGSVYWLLATVLPGFQAFRYPGKLLTFTALALSALAGIGWDRGREGRAARAPVFFLTLTPAGPSRSTANPPRSSAPTG